MPKERNYTPKQLEKAVEQYFQSISRVKTMVEKVDTGKKDNMGHTIYATETVVNQMGEPVTCLEYVIPPSVGDLAEYLGIHRSTWTEGYCRKEEYADTTTRARGRMHAYLERESLTRQGKDLKGILFNLENNYGYSERVEVNSQTIEEYLRQQEAGGCF